MVSKRIEKEIERIGDELRKQVKDGMFEDFLQETAENNTDLNEEDLIRKLNAKADDIIDFINVNYPERLIEREH